MRIHWLACLVVGFVCVACSGSSEIGKADIDQAFPKKSEGEIEEQLKKDPEAYRQYQESKQKDADYKAKGDTGR